MLTVFTFLAILPIGEHFHIVTALPDVFFGRDAPLNRVPSVDLAPLAEDDADPDQLKIGAKTALDLTWKEGLDAFTCTECGRCKDACPTFLTGKAAVAEVGQRRGEAPPRRVGGTDQGARRRQIARPHRRSHQRRDALGVHDLRLLRGRVPDRPRTPGEVLPPAPATGDDGRRVPGRTEQALLGVRVGRQPVGPRRRRARRLGEVARHSGGLVGRRSGRARLPLLRRLRIVVRPPGAEDRARVREGRAGRGCPHRHPRRGRRLDRRVRAAARQRDGVPAAGDVAGRNAERARREEES